MAAQHRKITLSKDQVELLKLLVDASTVAPDASFRCEPLRHVGFTWIIHRGFRQDARVAGWDDLVKLDTCGVLELHPPRAADESDHCSFILTDLATQVYDECKASPPLQGGTTFLVDGGVSMLD